MSNIVLGNYNLVVVIPHFHKERRENLDIIVNALNSNSVKPDAIVIFNNNRDYKVEIDGALCINSAVNIGSSVRYAMAYAMGAKYLIGHDDDLVLGHGDIDKLLSAMILKPNSVIGFCGANLKAGDNPYIDRTSWVAKGGLEEADIVLGRVTAMTRGVLARYMTKTSTMSLSTYGNHEDIPLCLANKEAGFSNYIMNLDVSELSTGGVGLEFQPDHFTHRNELAKL